MKKFSDEVEFKKELDSIGVRYGELNRTWNFYVEFVDNKGSALLFNGVFNTPISAIRFFPEVLKQRKLPAEDVDIYLRFAFSNEHENIEFRTIQCILDPYLYFTKNNVSGTGNETNSE